MFLYPRPALGHLAGGALHLDALKKLVHQGSLLREGVRQIGDAGGTRHLDWKSLDNRRLHVWWKCSGLQVQSLSPK